MQFNPISLATALPIPQPENTYILPALALADTNHYLGTELRRRIKVGDPLTLIHEPANPTDSSSVRVHWQDQLIGYLPDPQNELIAALLSQGSPLTSYVAWYSPTFDPPITIHILLPKP